MKRLTLIQIPGLLGIMCVLLGSLPSHGAANSTDTVTEITGEIEVVLEESIDGTVSNLYHVITDKATKKSYWLTFEGSPGKSLKSGAIVKARGRVKGDEFVVQSAGGSSFSLVQDSAATTGSRSLAVIIVNFLDTNPPCTKETAAAIIWPDPNQGSANRNVSDYYAEASSGAVDFGWDVDGNGLADVFGPYTVNARSTDACDYYAWAYDAEARAASDGVQLDRYQHLVFVVPTANTCVWAGVANVGCGTQCRAWIVGTNYIDAYAHELGHNLGMRHASTDMNNDGVTDNPYGDNSDIMGYAGVGYRHPNSAHKEQMGWFSGFDTVQNVDQPGRYTIGSLALAPWELSLPQVLKIRKQDTNEYYYLSYRTPLGYDSTIRSTYSYRLNVHRYIGNGASIETKLIAALVDGQTFKDTANNLTITQVGHSEDPVGGTVTVDVAFSASVQPPSVSVSPASQLTNTPGAPTSFQLSVINNDTYASASTFSFAFSLPAGWTATSQPAELSLSSGSSGTMTVTVVPPSTLPDGSHTLQLGVQDGTGAHEMVLRSAQYQLDSTPPAKVTGLSGSTDRKGRVNLSWNASNDGNGTGISQYNVYRSSNGGSLGYVGLSTTTTYQDAAVSSGASYTYTVSVVDRVGNVSPHSATATVTTQANSKGGGSGTKGGGGKRSK